MKYYVFPVGVEFSKNNLYNEVDESIPLMAACLFASNEEVINGSCDSQYNVYTSDGVFIECIDVTAKDCFLPNETDNGTSGVDETTNSTIDKSDNASMNDSIFNPNPNMDANEIAKGFGKNDICTVGQDGVHYYNSKDVFGMDENGNFSPDFDLDSSPYDEYGTEGPCGDISDIINKILQPDLNKADNQYNPLIARAFIKSSTFAQTFVNKYSFYIGASKVDAVGNYSDSLCIVIVGHDGIHTFPDHFESKEVDQLHNIFAVLLKCGIIYTEYGSNVFLAGSKRWNLNQIAGITKSVLCKCGLQYTGKPNLTDSLAEFNGSFTIPNELSFLK